jgi:hypothetical protein
MIEELNALIKEWRNMGWCPSPFGRDYTPVQGEKNRVYNKCANQLEEILLAICSSQPPVQADTKKSCGYCDSMYDMGFNFCGMCGRKIRSSELND